MLLRVNSKHQKKKKKRIRKRESGWWQRKLTAFFFLTLPFRNNDDGKEIAWQMHDERAPLRQRFSPRLNRWALTTASRAFFPSFPSSNNLQLWSGSEKKKKERAAAWSHERTHVEQSSSRRARKARTTCLWPPSPNRTDKHFWGICCKGSVLIKFFTW